MKNKQLRSLKKAIEYAENDPSSKYTTKEIRYQMKTRYRQLRQYIATANKMQSNGFGLKIPVPLECLMMDESTKLMMALIQVDNLTITDGGE